MMLFLYVAQGFLFYCLLFIRENSCISSIVFMVIYIYIYMNKKNEIFKSTNYLFCSFFLGILCFNILVFWQPDEVHENYLKNIYWLYNIHY